jgi:phosphoadenylyl-sulfate reductase (thioredoxin)
LFLDTEMLFPETLSYQTELADSLGLEDVRRIQPDRQEVFAHDPDGILHLAEPDACCALRKKAPLSRALKGFEAWVTGRKRFQTATRANLEFFEDEDGQRIKVNPLAHWAKQDILDYILNNRLPRHPLISRGFPSIGCMPCTSRVNDGEDERAGRWRGQSKDECGIHIIDGRVVRVQPAPDPFGTVQAHPEPDANVLVTDNGFAADDWIAGFETSEALDIPSDTDPAQLPRDFSGINIVRVDFPSFADGRGFTLARQLRRLGYTGRLRARGHVISDQYAMARRSGFDEVEIGPDLAKRQPQADWVFRGNWQDHDYQSRLRG